MPKLLLQLETMQHCSALSWCTNVIETATPLLSVDTSDSWVSWPQLLSVWGWKNKFWMSGDRWSWKTCSMWQKVLLKIVKLHLLILIHQNDFAGNHADKISLYLLNFVPLEVDKYLNFHVFLHRYSYTFLKASIFQKC